MRILFSSDQHGSEHHYMQALEAAAAEGADLVLLGGDFCPDFDTPAEQAHWVETKLVPWLQEFLHSCRCSIIGVPGNHDTRLAMEVLARSGTVALIHGQVHQTETVDLVGFCLSPPSPFGVKDYERRDLERAEPPTWRKDARVTGPDGRFVYLPDTDHFMAQLSLEEELALLPMRRAEKTLLLCHAPPAGGVLDRLYGDIQCGSVALQRFIVASQPLISLCGHAHESPFLSGRCGERIGRSLCINPGQAGDPIWASFDLKDVESTWTHSRGLPLL